MDYHYADKDGKLIDISSFLWKFIKPGYIRVELDDSTLYFNENNIGIWKFLIKENKLLDRWIGRIEYNSQDDIHHVKMVPIMFFIYPWAYKMYSIMTIKRSISNTSNEDSLLSKEYFRLSINIRKELEANCINKDINYILYNFEKKQETCHFSKFVRKI